MKLPAEEKECVVSYWLALRSESPIRGCAWTGDKVQNKFGGEELELGMEVLVFLLECGQVE
jgi:hypothetical protein